MKAMALAWLMGCFPNIPAAPLNWSVDIAALPKIDQHSAAFSMKSLEARSALWRFAPDDSEESAAIIGLRRRAELAAGLHAGRETAHDWRRTSGGAGEIVERGALRASLTDM